MPIINNFKCKSCTCIWMTSIKKIIICHVLLVHVVMTYGHSALHSHTVTQAVSLGFYIINKPVTVYRNCAFVQCGSNWTQKFKFPALVFGLILPKIEHFF